MLADPYSQNDWDSAALDGAGLSASQVQQLPTDMADIDKGQAPSMGTYSTTATGDSSIRVPSAGEYSAFASYATAGSIEDQAPAPIEVARFHSVDGVPADPSDTNLNHFHSMVVYDKSLSTGQFTKVKSLSDCCRGDGKVELHRWKNDGRDTPVVIKRVKASRVNANIPKETNERIVHRTRNPSHRDAEDTLTEFGVYTYLRAQQDVPEYILKMHDVFESGSDVWLVLEHADGGDLFNAIESANKIDTNQLQQWMWQLLRALAYLHKHGIAHRDISIENVLLCGGVVRLMDFGQAVQTVPVGGGEPFRYYNIVGKPYYTGPECYVPVDEHVEVEVPAGASPGDVVFLKTAGDFLCQVRLPEEATVGRRCLAESWGYKAAPNDVFACGICLFIMATGAPPWRRATLGDPHFAWVRSAGVVALLQAWQKPLAPEPMHLLSTMVNMDPSKRPSIANCLAHPWFAQLQGVDNALAADGVQETGLAGDNYALPEAHRNFVGSMLDAPSFPGALSGDFYKDSEDPSASGQPPHLEAPPSFCDLAPAVAIAPSLERFVDGDVAPNAPSDEHFVFEPTTLRIDGSTSVLVANHVLDFFSAACAGAVVTKVDRKKFTMKVAIGNDSGGCTLKVRIYQAATEQYAVEFQRRQGYAAAFRGIYRDASIWLGRVMTVSA